MSLANRLATPPAPVHGKPCSIRVALDTLPPAESDALQAMLNDPTTWSATMIYAALADEGVKVGKQTISRHRLGYCRCGGGDA